MAVHIGELIKALREDAGLSVRDLARASGVDSGIISRIENGKQRGLASQNLASVAQVLGTTADSLLRESRERDVVEMPKRTWPTLREWLDRDRNLTDKQRDAIEAVYEGYVRPR